jgi:hypothetical protein
MADRLVRLRVKSIQNPERKKNDVNFCKFVKRFKKNLKLDVQYKLAMAKAN